MITGLSWLTLYLPLVDVMKGLMDAMFLSFFPN